MSNGTLSLRANIYGNKVTIDLDMTDCVYKGYKGSTRTVELVQGEELLQVLEAATKDYLVQKIGYSMDKANNVYRFYMGGSFPEKYSVLFQGSVYKCTVEVSEKDGLQVNVEPDYGNPVKELKKLLDQLTGFTDYYISPEDRKEINKLLKEALNE